LLREDLVLEGIDEPWKQLVVQFNLSSRNSLIELIFVMMMMMMTMMMMTTRRSSHL